MKLVHLLKDGPDGKRVRICDGKPSELPLPHHTDQVKLCPACDASKDNQQGASRLGLGLSMTQVK